MESGQILCMFLKESKQDFLMTWIWNKEEGSKEQLEGWGDYEKDSVARGGFVQHTSSV